MSAKSNPTNNLVKPSGRRVSVPLMTEAKLRRTPLHARGQATFNKILEVTSMLLEEIGHENITTNIIAQAAGINISTLYGYFSNKQGIMLALFDQQNEERSVATRNIIAGVRKGTPWRKAFSAGIDAAVAMRKSQRGALALRLAMKSSPELQQHDRASSEAIIDEVAEELRAIAGLETQHSRLVARCSMEIVTSLLDLWVGEEDPTDTSLVDEAKRATLAYMALYFEPQSSSASSHAR